MSRAFTQRLFAWASVGIVALLGAWRASPVLLYSAGCFALLLGSVSALAQVFPARLRSLHARLVWEDDDQHNPMKRRLKFSLQGVQALGGRILALKLVAPPSIELDQWRALRTDSAEATILVRAACTQRMQGVAVRLASPFGGTGHDVFFPAKRAFVPMHAAMTPRPRRRNDPRSEFHQIRELVPGDSSRRVAWQASMRRGRLMVREDAEVSTRAAPPHHVIVDMRRGMFVGAPGERPVDFLREWLRHCEPSNLSLHFVGQFDFGSSERFETATSPFDALELAVAAALDPRWAPPSALDDAIEYFAREAGMLTTSKSRHDVERELSRRIGNSIATNHRVAALAFCRRHGLWTGPPVDLPPSALAMRLSEISSGLPKNAHVSVLTAPLERAPFVDWARELDRDIEVVGVDAATSVGH